ARPAEPSPAPSHAPEMPPADAAEDADLPDVKFESMPVSPPRRDMSVTYGVTVRNTSPEPLYQVRVEHDLPPGPRFLSASPAPGVQESKLVWALGTLEPGATHEIQVTVQPNYPGEIADDAIALFRVFQCVHVVTGLLNPAAGAPRTRSDARAGHDQYLLFTVADTDF